MQISKVYQTRVFAPRNKCSDRRRQSFAKDRHSVHDLEPRRIRIAASEGTTMDVTSDRFSLALDICSTIGNTPMVYCNPTNSAKRMVPRCFLTEFIKVNLRRLQQSWKPWSLVEGENTSLIILI